MAHHTTSAAAPPAPGPVSTTIRAAWRADKRYEITNAAGATSVVDGTGQAGPGAIDTLLASLAACSAMDVGPYMEKRRTPLERLDIVVTGTRRAEVPRRLVAISVEFRLHGATIERAHAERAASLALSRHCSVASSLAPDIEMTLAVSLNDDDATPVELPPRAT
jgi:putative redox protein